MSEPTHPATTSGAAHGDPTTTSGVAHGDPTTSSGRAHGEPTATSGAAPAGRRLAAQAVFETRTILRNGEQLLVSLILPAIILAGLARTPVLAALGVDIGDRPPVDAALAGVLGLAIGSSAFTGQAIQTAFDRRYGVLRQLATTPLGARGLLGGKLIAVAVVVLVQFLIIGALAWALGYSGGHSAAAVALTAVIGTAMLLAWALVMAGTLRAEATLALANLLWVLMAAVGGLLVAHPGSWGRIVSWLPSGALGDAMRAAVLDGQLDVRALVIMAVWAAVGILTGVRFFSFDSR